MTTTQLLNFVLRRKSYKAQDCTDWMRAVLQKFVDDGVVSPTVAVDNALSQLESVFAEFPDPELLRLAPHSFLLNPMELELQGMRRTAFKIKNLGAHQLRSDRT